MYIPIYLYLLSCWIQIYIYMYMTMGMQWEGGVAECQWAVVRFENSGNVTDWNALRDGECTYGYPLKPMAIWI